MDTLIQTTNGIREIQSLFPAPTAELTPEGEYNAHTDEGKIRTYFGDHVLETGYLYYDGVKPAIRITTKTGKTLIGSHAHPVLAIDTRKGQDC
jgi:intein/homing endonuclease